MLIPSAFSISAVNGAGASSSEGSAVTLMSCLTPISSRSRFARTSRTVIASILLSVVATARRISGVSRGPALTAKVIVGTSISCAIWTSRRYVCASLS